MTKEFALYSDDAFARIERHETQPDDKPRSGVTWFPVARNTGPAEFEGLVDGEYTITKLEKPTPEPRRQGSWREFRALFTYDEQKALAGAAMQNVDVKLWYDDAVAADFIDLDSPSVVAGFDVMVAARLVTAKRRDEILSGNFEDEA